MKRRIVTYNRGEGLANMIATLRPLKTAESVQRDLKQLQQIADKLGIGINTFHKASARHLFHTAEDGTQWFLVSGLNGRPAVRQISIAANCSEAPNETVEQFIAKNVKTSQGLALAALIDRLLLTCLR